MADIFISYSQADRAWVERLARLIEAQGFSVWWDVKVLPGDEFGDMVVKEIATSKCVVVVWSKHSVQSDWVYGEADEARRAKKLVPVIKDEVHLPTAFRKIHTADLSSWDQTTDGPEVAVLIDAIRGRVKHAMESGGAPAEPVPPASPYPPAPPPGYPGYAPPTYPPQGYAPQGYAPTGYPPQSYPPSGYVAPASAYAHQGPRPPSFMTVINGHLDRIAAMNKLTLRLVAVAAVILIAVKYISWLPNANPTAWGIYWMLSEWAYAGVFAVLAFSNKPFMPQVVRLFLCIGALTNALQLNWVFLSIDNPPPALGAYCIAYVANLGLFAAIAFFATPQRAAMLRPFALVAIAYYAVLDASNSSFIAGADQVLLAFAAVAMHVVEAIVVCMAPLQFAGRR
jgi:hypothetical protein